MAGDDDFDITKYVLRLSKKIAQLTKDYVGLPFSTASQLPFSIDTRPQEKSKFFTSSRKWQKGDALVGFHAARKGQKRLILNLPDGSTMLDMCYPGWEVAILEPPSLEHFFHRRYLFGDYYGHFLVGTTRPLPTKPDSSTAASSQEEANAAMVRQTEVFRKRRASLEDAAEQQQRRGVPFNAHSEADTSSSQDYTRHETTFSSLTSKGHEETALQKALVTVTIGTRSVRDATTGTIDNRLVIQKKYNTGEIETTEKRSQSALLGQADSDLEQLLASDIFKVFPDTAKASLERQPDCEETRTA